MSAAIYNSMFILVTSVVGCKFETRLCRGFSFACTLDLEACLGDPLIALSDDGKAVVFPWVLSSSLHLFQFLHSERCRFVFLRSLVQVWYIHAFVLCVPSEVYTSMHTHISTSSSYTCPAHSANHELLAN